MKGNNQIKELSLEDIELIEDNNEEDDKEFISLLTDLVYTAPYEQYVINFLNKIIKDNYKKIEPLFKKKNYNIEALIKEFNNPNIIFFKKKDKKNKSSDNKMYTNKNLIQANSDSENRNNKSEKKINLKDEKSNINSISSLKYRISYEKIFEESEIKEEKKLLSEILNESEDKRAKGKNHEIKDFFDTFNFNGKEFEIHVQILLAQILKCYEEKINSFQFLCNVEFKIENIFPNLNDIEFDFLINNLDVELFKKFLNYLKKNILILNFRGNFYDINDNTNFNDINFDIENNKKFDILGEIGLNAINDDNKVEQFQKYSKLLNDLSKSNIINNTKIDLFYDKTGFKKENEKILFFVTNSKFNDVYKFLKKSKLYKEMKKSQINFILCYISVGLNEQIILSNFILNENNRKEKNEEKEEKKENKENNASEKEMKKKEDIKDKEEQEKKIIIETDLLRKIKISNDGFIKSEKFKHLCFKLNELVSGINKIKLKFFEKEKGGLSFIINSFSEAILQNEIILNKDLQEYFNINISDIIEKEKPKENKINIIYLKASTLIGNDIVEENLKKMNMNMNINTISIYIKEDEEISKKTIEDLKKNHKFETFYLIICNYKLIMDDKMEKFVNEMINNLKININHYIFKYNSRYKSNKKYIFDDTLKSNVFIIQDENILMQQLEKTIKKINLNSKDLNIIYREKKYYDKFIEIYLNNTAKNIIKTSEDNKTDFINKVNEILYFMSNLDFPNNLTDKIDKNFMEDLFELIKTVINKHIKDEYESKIEEVFNNLNVFFKSKKELLNSSKDKTKDFCFNYLKTIILKYIYGFFIKDTIPKISYQIYNKKIEKYLMDKQNIELVNK